MCKCKIYSYTFQQNNGGVQPLNRRVTCFSLPHVIRMSKHNFISGPSKTRKFVLMSKLF